MKGENNKRIIRILVFLIPVIIIAGSIFHKEHNTNELTGFEDKQLVINEIVADNLSGLQDNNGRYNDWIEIYNCSSDDINLSSYYLSDEKNDLTRCELPDYVLKSGEYLIIYCSDILPDESNEIYVDFSLDSLGDSVYLSDSEGVIKDSMTFPEQYTDVAFGRKPDEYGKLGYFSYSTPRQANPVTFWKNFAEVGNVESEVRFSKPGGNYKDSFELELSCDDDDKVILYTLDGSTPDISSNVYKSPLLITSVDSPNRFVTQKCMSNTDEIDNADIEYGVNPVFKGTVVKARILDDGELSSKIYTQSYFVGAEYSMPVISLNVDSDEMFDTKDGMYVLGMPYYTARKLGIQSSELNNFNISNELDGYLEIYSEEGTCEFQNDISVTFSGGSSRNNLQKSFKISIPDSVVNGSLFGLDSTIEYKEMVLRGSGGGIYDDAIYTYPSSFITNYIEQLPVASQKSRQCILFINGEYWGIYSLTEPKGKEYINQHFGVQPKDVEIIKTYEFETTKEFDAFYDQVAARDFSKEENYEWIKTQINMESFIQFVLAEAYFYNADGMLNGDHNYYIWRDMSGDSQYSVWNWQLFDMDSTLESNEPYIQHILDFNFDEEDGEEKKNFTMYLFKCLWKCEEFRNDFYNAFKKDCETIYKPDNIVAAYDEHINELRAEMLENLKRRELGYSRYKRAFYKIMGWDTEYDNFDMNDWELLVEQQRNFLLNRADSMQQEMFGE